MALTILKNLDLDDSATSEQTGTVGEPSVAATGQRMFVTRNWFASRSTDSGTSWSLIDPFTELPSAAGGFCCDQIVSYSQPFKVWVWILQYIKSGGSNVLRVAASSTGASGSWRWWDFSAPMLNASWKNLWLDYPDLAESAKNLWLTSNVFDGSNRWKRAVVLIGYFANGSGEQWIFTRDRATGAASLRRGDVDWTTVHVVRDGRVEGLLLNAEEAAWLQACWSAASAPW